MGGRDERRGKATPERCWLGRGVMSKEVVEGVKATLGVPGASPTGVLSEAEDPRGAGM